MTIKTYTADINQLSKGLQDAVKRMEKTPFYQMKFYIYQYEVLPLKQALESAIKCLKTSE